MNFRFCIPIFFAAPLFAGEMCATLCTTCSANPMDSVCSGIDSLCYCSDVLDSIRQVEIREARAREFAVAKLSKGMDLLCRRKFCSLDLQFCGDSLVKIQTAKTPLRIKSKAHNDSTKIEEPEEPLLTQTKECRNFCRLCPEEKRNDSNCVQIENICGCRAFAEQTERLAQKAKADSLQKLEGWIARNRNIKASADSVLKFQKESGDSLFMVTFATKDFQILDIRKTEISSPKAPQDTVTSRAIVALQDSAPKSLQVLTESAVADLDTLQMDSTPKKDKRIFYMGLSLFAGRLVDKDTEAYGDYNGDLYLDCAQGFSAGGGFLMRRDFFKYGSFLLGLNAVYQFSHLNVEEDSYSYPYSDPVLRYHKILAEVPLEFRLRIPQKIGPFLSYTMYIRKPICVWYHLTMDGYSGTYADADSYDDWMPSGYGYEMGSFEFLGFVGVGVEFFHRLSVAFQCLLYSEETYRRHSFSESPETIGTWRIKMDLIF